MFFRERMMEDFSLKDLEALAWDPSWVDHE